MQYRIDAPATLSRCRVAASTCRAWMALGPRVSCRGRDVLIPSMFRLPTMCRICREVVLVALRTLELPMMLGQVWFERMSRGRIM